jgi:hypothetical protein
MFVTILASALLAPHPALNHRTYEKAAFARDEYVAELEGMRIKIKKDIADTMRVVDPNHPKLQELRDNLADLEKELVKAKAKWPVNGGKKE